MKNEYTLFEKGRRPWGEWEVIAIGDTHIIKRISVNPHASLSLQMHHHRFEHWFLTKGTALVTIGEEKREISAHHSVDIPVLCKHRLENVSDMPVEFIEIQTGDILDENDIVRFEDIYNRVSSNS